MRKYAVLLAFAAMFGTSAWCGQQHPASGIVIEVGKTHRSMVVSCEAIPGYMEAMEMSFTVRDSSMLTTIKPGMTIHFTIVDRDHVLYAEDIRATTAANLESEPMEAGGLTALQAGLRLVFLTFMHCMMWSTLGISELHSRNTSGAQAARC